MTITDFLLARIAEDEKLAKAAAVSMHGEHHADRHDWASYTIPGERDTTAAQDDFITEWWPARVLAECAAKRAIIEAWSPPSETDGWAVDGHESAYHAGLHRALCALAAVYADHPDHREEWAPS